MEKEIERKINLLNILVQEKKWFTLLELEKRLNSSSKTIRKDIVVINDLLPTGTTIHSKKGKGVKLSLPQDQSISEVISKLLKQSRTFLVLQQLLEESSSTVTSLSENLYLPISSTNTVLRRLARYIKKFGLSLQKKPLQIIGNEFQIILMFSERYLEAFIEDEWPFPEYKEEVLLSYVDYIEEKLGILFYSNDRRRLVFILAILFKRMNQGYKVQFSEWVIKNTLESLYYKKIFEGEHIIKKDGNRPLHIEEQVLLIIIIKLSSYVSENETNSKREELTLYTEGKIQAYVYIKNFIDMLEQELQMDLASHEDFVYGMIEYCRNTFYILKFLPRIKAPEKDTCAYIKKNYKETFDLVKKAYIKWGKQLKLTDIPDEEVAKVTMRIAAIGKLPNKNRKKVLLLTGEGKSWEEYMKSCINKRYGDQLEFIEGKNKRVLQGDIEGMDVDFIITTVPLNITVKSIVYVSPILQERDFYEIGISVNQ
ncbi:BglG family transcription antiterminator [Bacillus cytotoxicus]|uniref:BglG family transcription antiterminator n=1 Tax=Bacillus cytotoxicus TaxID=580165 RepID=UPI000863CBDD|nr:helix-turn-helix domain-containing protein [Bacillus cytotoxicus]AWC30238.1 capsule biosynthesis protein [Bacillus cytotoxicus]AWC42378.1 capsule biosynthesis protein [Bacillus cytotoxicus]AWC50309.1 capsule biosynthesis protein [Bacillus cytotoxicus]AWC54364.1 capsule biosynthesis protein [Bacillus cytotoxicus]AWC58488.1 capsule biosynthesis protein [Bacillus cytotoxicus]